MDTSLESATDEAARLRRCLNDLVRITALPTVCAGREPPQIVGTLLDALLGILRLDFVVARLSDRAGGPPTELVRTAEGAGGTAVAQQIASARLGIDGEVGIIVAGSLRLDFPDEIERLLLDVAANQAAVGLQHARLLGDQTRRADESARESRVIVDSIPGLVALLSPAGFVETVNRPLLEYFGQTLEELRQWGTNGTVHPEDLPHVVDVFTRSITSGTPYEIVQRLRRGDGVYRWIQNSGFPLRGTSGQIARWCVLLTDIDDRKHAEDALKRSEAFLLEGQRLARMGNFSWRVASEEILWSDQVYRMFEFEPGTRVTLERIGTRVHPEDIPMLFDMIERAQRAVTDFEYEHRIVMPDRSIKYIHLIAHGSQDENGRLEYIGAVHDVTQRKLAEEALGNARSELAHVARVTSLGTLTASIAHEVNQPLSGIITNASTCLRMLDASPPDVDGARETARRTIRDGNRASDVITRLRLLFSRKEFTLESLDLNEATREVIALSLGDLQRRRVILQSDLAGDLPLIRGDRVQLQQVILNLLRNASDAMIDVHDRPRQLLIRTECEEGDRIRLTVRDSGIGLDPRNADKLFDTFYTTKKEGMGIGLSISRSIIERHRGRLWAEPNDGPGAAFTFSIPRWAGSVMEALPAMTSL